MQCCADRPRVLKIYRFIDQTIKRYSIFNDAVDVEIDFYLFDLPVKKNCTDI